MQLILDQHREMGGKSVIFAGGGEPLANPATIDCIEYARKSDLSIGLITNGAILPHRDEDRLCKSCSWIRVSWDAGSDKMHRHTHGSYDWVKILDNTQRLSRVPNRNATVGVSYLLSEATADDAVNAAYLAASVGLDYIQFKPFDGDNYDPANVLAEVRTSDPQIDVVGFFQREDDGSRCYSKCHAAHFITEVAADGTVYPCCVCRNRHVHALGNIHDSTLGDILSGQEDILVSGCPKWCRNHNLNTVLEQYFGARPAHSEFI
jgi:MoaA/NifB/PqqE/SkfB family radical SAM enzyme